MVFRSFVLVLAVGFVLSGCASLGDNRAPKCSGYDQRPLNRSMWNWDKDGPAQPPAPVAKPGAEGAKSSAITPTQRSARFDDAASRRSCKVG